MSIVQVEIVGYKPPSRFARIPVPAEVTEAWYANDCPPDFNPRGLVSMRAFMVWRLRTWLVGRA